MTGFFGLAATPSWTERGNPMPRSKDTRTVGSLVKEAIDEGCREQGITRGELAERLGLHRVSLYNLLKRPGGISLEVLIRLMHELDIEDIRQCFLVYKWCEDRSLSNPFAGLLFPVIQRIGSSNGVEPERIGREVLKVFREQQRRRRKS